MVNNSWIDEIIYFVPTKSCSPGNFIRVMFSSSLPAIVGFWVRRGTGKEYGRRVRPA